MLALIHEAGTPQSLQQLINLHHLREKPRGSARGRERGPRSGPDGGLKSLEILYIQTA